MLQCLKLHHHASECQFSFFVADLQYEVEVAKRKTAAKVRELQEVKARCDAVQGGKEKTETELLQCIKHRREAQLAWNEQRAALECKVQVCKVFRVYA